jgi:hypothetical protein
VATEVVSSTIRSKIRYDVATAGIPVETRFIASLQTQTCPVNTVETLHATSSQSQTQPVLQTRCGNLSGLSRSVEDSASCRGRIPYGMQEGGVGCVSTERRIPTGCVAWQKRISPPACIRLRMYPRRDVCRHGGTPSTERSHPDGSPPRVCNGVWVCRNRACNVSAELKKILYTR